MPPRLIFAPTTGIEILPEIIEVPWNRPLLGSSVRQRRPSFADLRRLVKTPLHAHSPKTLMALAVAALCALFPRHERCARARHTPTSHAHHHPERSAAPAGRTSTRPCPYVRAHHLAPPQWTEWSSACLHAQFRALEHRRGVVDRPAPRRRLRQRQGQLEPGVRPCTPARAR